jgi:microcompartment protein CcmL/EutN
MLADIHEQVHDAILGQRQYCKYAALGIIETTTVAATIKSADAAIKSTNIDIVEIRLADDIGGKAFAIYSGDIEDVQTAISISKDAVTKKEYWIRDIIIPRLSEEIATQINKSTIFAKVDIHKLEESEI